MEVKYKYSYSLFKLATTGLVIGGSQPSEAETKLK